ncbi:MAG: alpha/beta fold hydrolase [Proteobacteria bacterium]|nr:alpha/beta fold hydrolase [Burkholderiales bacterium]
MSGVPATARAWTTLAEALKRKPEVWQSLGREYNERHLALWQRTIGTACAPGPADVPAHTAAAGPREGGGDEVRASIPEVPAAVDAELDALAAADPRFTATDWAAHPWFDYLRRAYLLNASWLNRALDAADLEPQTAQRTRFFLRQWLDALAPTNFVATNPEVLALASRTGGESLARGLKQFAAEVERGQLTMTDERAFEVGRDLASTPGAVIHRNEIAELIHYRPHSARVHARPLLIVPPFINKYYILDLQPHNSFVRFALEQGFNVFIVSWRDTPADLGHLRWDDYAERGVLAAIDIARDVCGSAQVTALGFCVGGTLLSTALALAAARGQQPAASVTLLATMLDFSDVGEIGAYVERDFVEDSERRYCKTEAPDVMPGRDLAFTFASLRANDLIWRFVVDHWLKGKSPERFDLLYWNSDAANVPGALYAWYLRHMYFENSLRVPGRLALRGTPLDLRRIRCAWYLLAAEDDHIVPWRTAWLGRRLLRGSREFVLAASGHIAGVINPATRNRRHYYTAGAPSRTPDAWLAQAQRASGSWWTHWAGWAKRRSGRLIDAPERLGNDAHPALGDAPGDYVRRQD